VSIFNKPLGDLFEMSYLEKFSSFIIRIRGKTVVFQDDNDIQLNYLDKEFDEIRDIATNLFLLIE